MRKRRTLFVALTSASLGVILAFQWSVSKGAIHVRMKAWLMVYQQYRCAHNRWPDSPAIALAEASEVNRQRALLDKSPPDDIEQVETSQDEIVLRLRSRTFPPLTETHRLRAEDCNCTK